MTIHATDFFSEDEYNAARYEEDMGYQGDPRRCEIHPNVVISSPDGMFDGVCGACEAACDDDREAAQIEAGEIERAPLADPNNFNDIPF